MINMDTNDFKDREQWEDVWKSGQPQSPVRRIASSIYRAIQPAASPFNYFLADWLARWLVLRDLIVLDVGGAGGLGAVLHHRVKKYILLDYSNEAIKRARALLAKYQNAECVLGDLFEYAPAQKPDLVISVGLIEHFFGDSQGHCVDAHRRLSGRYVCLCAPSSIPLNWWRHYRFEATKEYPSQRPVREKDLFDVMLSANLIPIAMTRLDPWYGRMPTSRFAKLVKSSWAAYWPNKRWALDRMDGGLIVALGEINDA